MYSESIRSSSDILFSIGLQRASHCILNKSYSKNEYDSLPWKLIDHMKSTGEWGEFFSASMSPFWYNESAAQEYFPLMKEEAIQKWYKWKEDRVGKEYQWTVYIPLPISNYDETKVSKEEAKQNINECLQWVIKCEVTGKPFKITSQELLFYIENGYQIPTKHHLVRYKERMSQRNPRKLYDRKYMCPNCETPEAPMYTTYAPDREETVYCASCYRDEVYG